MDSKAFWKSKTLWFNILAVVVLVASEFGFVGDVIGSDELVGYVRVFVPAIVAAINIGLRIITKVPLALS